MPSPSSPSALTELPPGGRPHADRRSPDHQHPAGSRAARDESALGARYRAVRARSEALIAPLQPEDCVVSSMPDVSPTKWHLAHTSWFFETFVLRPQVADYRSPDGRYAFLFNSYYVQAGERHCRAQRGLVTRPTLAEVLAYRAHVDDAMERLCARADAGALPADVAETITIGLHHEQQHQELMLSDIKHVFWTNPLRPAYADDSARPSGRGVTAAAAPVGWRAFDGGLYTVGAGDDAGFTFDNERPAHPRYVAPFQLASRLVTNGEYAAFVEDGGYERATLWLSSGWATARAEGWRAPLYWEHTADGWHEFTLRGTAPLDPALPVAHVSFYEAEAFARWAGCRLPTEDEWEVAAPPPSAEGSFLESGRWHPAPASGDQPLQQLYGELWQFTASPYVGYPGFRPPDGALGEYNGKFMCDQWVLRGASCATPRTHARRTYRNFYPASARWQFGGVRLARGA